MYRHCHLGGGFKYFLFSPLIWGRFPIWLISWLDGWKPPTRHLLQVHDLLFWGPGSPCWKDAPRTVGVAPKGSPDQIWGMEIPTRFWGRWSQDCRFLRDGWNILVCVQGEGLKEFMFFVGFGSLGEAQWKSLTSRQMGGFQGLGIEMMEWSMLRGKIPNEVHYDKLTVRPFQIFRNPGIAGRFDSHHRYKSPMLTGYH